MSQRLNKLELQLIESIREFANAAKQEASDNAVALDIARKRIKELEDMVLTEPQFGVSGPRSESVASEIKKIIMGAARKIPTDIEMKRLVNENNRLQSELNYELETTANLHGIINRLSEDNIRLQSGQKPRKRKS